MDSKHALFLEPSFFLFLKNPDHCLTRVQFEFNVLLERILIEMNAWYF